MCVCKYDYITFYISERFDSETTYQLSFSPVCTKSESIEVVRPITVRRVMYF